MSEAVRTRNLNVSQAIAEAIEREMEENSRIIVLGEDVGAMGGTFGTTRRLHRRFGGDRVRDTPIAEMAFTGMGVGLAMSGYRPIVEIMFVDFVGAASNRCSTRWRRSRTCPVGESGFRWS